jgi:hypothetical protein
VADIFVITHGDDRTQADMIVNVLGRLGWTVSWYPKIVPQPSLEEAMARELASARCAVVLWSKASVAADWIRNRAWTALQRSVLIQVMLEPVAPPLIYMDTPVINLVGWRSNLDDSNLLDLIALIRQYLARTTPDVPFLARSPTGVARPSRAGGADYSAPELTKDHATYVFLCYRRDDSQDAAGRLYDRLVDTYGAQRVFMDIDSVPLGMDFVDHVSQEIAKCSVVIVMIGIRWLTIKDKKRRRRLDNEDDLVRAEIRAALQQKIPVLPVTVQNAAMPQSEDLPDDIRPLARRNGIELSAIRWKTDVERLIKELDRVMKG